MDIIENLGVANIQVNLVSASGGMEESASGIMEELLDNFCVYNAGILQPILVNGNKIGKTASTTELVRVSYLGRECFVQLFYDEGSQITLLNPQCTPIVCDSRKSDRPIRIILFLVRNMRSDLYKQSILTKSIR